MKFLQRVFILGAGLIGGSIAKRLRKIHSTSVELVAFSRNPERLHFIAPKTFDEVLTYQELEKISFGKGDLIVISLPPVLSLLHAWKLPPAHPKALFMDVTSVKYVFSLCCEYPNFVPSHPMAGSHLSGFSASSAELFENKKTFITPLERNSSSAIKIVSDLWKSLGAEVVLVSPLTHDEIVSKTSHLPHLLSFLASSMVGKRERDGVSSGYRDFSRLANSSPELWEEIISLNPFMIEFKNFKKFIKNKLPSTLASDILSRSKKHKAIFGKTTRTFHKKLIRTINDMGGKNWLKEIP